jgi:site-specific recombinase
MPVSEDQRIAAVQRRAEVIEYRRLGMTFAEIGAQMGFSTQRAYTLYREALSSVLAPAVEAHRAELLAELAEARRVAREVMAADHPFVQQGHVVSEIVDHDENGKPVYGDPLLDVGPKLDAARTLVALVAREGRLTGAEAPVRVDATVTETTQADLELADLIAEQKAKNSLREAEIKEQA